MYIAGSAENKIYYLCVLLDKFLFLPKCLAAQEWCQELKSKNPYCSRIGCHVLADFESSNNIL